MLLEIAEKNTSNLMKKCFDIFTDIAVKYDWVDLYEQFDKCLNYKSSIEKLAHQELGVIGRKKYFEAVYMMDSIDEYAVQQSNEIDGTRFKLIMQDGSWRMDVLLRDDNIQKESTVHLVLRLRERRKSSVSSAGVPSRFVS